MQRRRPARMSSSRTTVGGVGEVIDAGKSRVRVRNGSAANATNAASATTNAATAALRIEPLHEQADRHELQRDAARQQHARERAADTPRERADDQRDRG